MTCEMLLLYSRSSSQSGFGKLLYQVELVPSHITNFPPHITRDTSQSTGCVPVVEYDRNFWQGAFDNVLECNGRGSGARKGSAVLPFAFVRGGWDNVDVVVIFLILI